MIYKEEWWCESVRTKAKKRGDQRGCPCEESERRHKKSFDYSYQRHEHRAWRLHPPRPPPSEIEPYKKSRMGGGWTRFNHMMSLWLQRRCNERQNYSHGVQQSLATTTKRPDLVSWPKPISFTTIIHCIALKTHIIITVLDIASINLNPKMDLACVKRKGTTKWVRRRFRCSIRQKLTTFFLIGQRRTKRTQLAKIEKQRDPIAYLKN